MKTLFLIVLGALAFITSANSQSTDIEYYPELVFSFQDGDYVAEDGDSFWIGIHQVRLHGIDTVEKNQRCRDEVGDVDCHSMTMAFLESHLLDPSFSCRVHKGKRKLPRTSHNRYIVTCFVDNQELNSIMVENGWAVAANGTDGEHYHAKEAIAKAAGRGLHQWEFTHPHEFRNPPSKECTCD